MTDTPETISVPATTPVPVPSQDEIDAALRILLRAWSPSSVPADAPVDSAALAVEDEYEPYDGCNCAGSDDDGEPLGCNCGGGCTCDSCYYFEYSRAKTCQAGPHTTGLDMQCGKTTTHRVVGFRLDGRWRSTSDIAQCPHRPEDACPCASGVVYIDHGARPMTHQTLTACSAAHAQALVERMIQVYNEPADKPTRLRWYIEQWTYEPHDIELPDPLPALRGCIRGLQSSIGQAVASFARHGDTETWLTYVRQDLARAARHAAMTPERPTEDDDPDDEISGPVQEEPDGGDLE